MKRLATIDVCRGLLFVLMANTHALTIAAVPATHLLFSDFWLPNGWATVVFVVLSGYGVGYIYSVRQPERTRDADLIRRGLQILAVMFVSNAVFAFLRQVALGELDTLIVPAWWLGFLTLETDWTISGVLLPTGLVLLCGPLAIRVIRRARWVTLSLLVFLQVVATVAALEARNAPYATIWAMKFLLLEGFGGFPVLPFVLNGLLGVWLGMERHRNVFVWRTVIFALLALQLCAYVLALSPTEYVARVFINSVGAVGKFAWMFLVAHVIASSNYRFVAGPVELTGRYALGSFVMHRVFLQSLGLLMGGLGLMKLPAEARYVALLLGTLVLTWTLCMVRERVGHADRFFRRVFL